MELRWKQWSRLWPAVELRWPDGRGFGWREVDRRCRRGVGPALEFRWRQWSIFGRLLSARYELLAYNDSYESLCPIHAVGDVIVDVNIGGGAEMAGMVEVSAGGGTETVGMAKVFGWRWRWIIGVVEALEFRWRQWSRFRPGAGDGGSRRAFGPVLALKWQ
ncbi:hypothetical protein [Nocardia goodfellowii]|nr:hypothetical protein [Nocardia goodfellowii]